jgi:hypothetical protein
MVGDGRLIILAKLCTNVNIKCKVECNHICQSQSKGNKCLTSSQIWHIPLMNDKFKEMKRKKNFACKEMTSIFETK